MATLEQEVTKLQSESENLERQMKLSNEYQFNLSEIKQACALVADNVSTLSFKQKRLALQALQISVTIDGDKVTLYGSVPVKELFSVSAQSKLTV